MLPFFFYGPVEIMIWVVALVIALAAQAGVSGAYKKYKQVSSSRGLTGAEVARKMVQGLGVEVVMNNGGELSDHFDPRKKTIRLSPDVYNGTNVAAIGIAAHEAGHALQYDQGYAPIKLRNGILPIAQIGSMAAIPLVFLGLFLGGDYGNVTWLIDLGIALFIGVLAFQLITLPVEFNASRRAIAALDHNVYLTPEESAGAKKVLRTAAMTYVAAVAVSALQLLRLILISRRRR
ncbi:MAG: zinc metallopeptidase [Oscillospiraceae bacterium]|nr:zinc metallopeptidase [Oscillospiraceae bacterium]